MSVFMQIYYVKKKSNLGQENSFARKFENVKNLFQLLKDEREKGVGAKVEAANFYDDLKIISQHLREELESFEKQCEVTKEQTLKYMEGKSGATGKRF